MSGRIALTLGMSKLRVLCVSILGFLLVLLLFLVWYLLNVGNERIREGVSATLTTNLNAANDQIELWVTDRMAILDQLCQRADLNDAIGDLLKLPPTATALLPSAELARVREIFAPINWHQGFFIINTSRVNVGSMRDNNLGIPNVIGKHRPEMLDKAFEGETQFIPPIRSDVFLAEDKSTTRLPMTMFLAAPIRREGEVVAVCTLRLDPKYDFSQVIHLGRWGKTGETLAFDSTGKLVTLSRFQSELQQLGLIQPNDGDDQIFELKDPGFDLTAALDPTHHRTVLSLTEGVAQAIRGTSGQNLTGYRNHLGILVFGAWTWNSKCHLGLVSEISIAEAMAPYRVLRDSVLGAFGISFSFLVLGMGLLVQFARKTRQLLVQSLADLEAGMAEKSREERSSEGKFRALIANLPGVSLRRRLDAKWTTLFISDGALALTGYPPERFAGESACSLKDIVHRSDLSSLEDSLRKTIRDGTPMYAEYRIITATRALKWVAERGRAIQEEAGEPIIFESVLFDISDRKAVEKRLRKTNTTLDLALDAGHIGVWSVNLKNRLLEIDERGKSLFGLPSKANLTPDDLIDCLIPEDRLGFQEDLERALAAHRNFERECFVPKEDGVRTLLVCGQATRDDFGEARRIHGIAFDLTPIKVAEGELRKEKIKAEAAVAAKSQFLANMSHEIRTPMNAILGFLELVLESKDLPQDLKKHLETAHYSASNLLQIINDILDLSKLESGKFALDIHAFSLPQMVFADLRTFVLMAKEKGLSLTFVYDPKLPDFFLGDPLRLSQVLINLIRNSIKFTEKGSISVKVAPGEGGMLEFSVSDTGIGIPKDKLDSIFESFTQVDTAARRRFGGTGLGTTICKQIVEKMGGRIWVESQLGEGSTFYFQLPLVATEPTPEIVFESRRSRGERMVSPRAFRILVAEDVPQNAELVKIRLQEQNHTVVVTRNGQEALEAWRNGSFDAILMDVQMPVMDGLEATRAIRQSETKEVTPIPIIALTASVMKEDKSHYLSAGMNAVVAKPIDFQELFQLLEALVPQGTAEENHAPNPIKGTSAKIDLSSLKEVADIGEALRAWRSPVAYHRNLISFAHRHQGDPADITQALESGNLTELRRLNHTLKGVAGNLGFDPLFQSCEAVSKELRKAGSPVLREAVAEMLKRLREAFEAIQHLGAKVRSNYPTTGSGDRSETLRHIIGLFDRRLADHEAPTDLMHDLVVEIEDRVHHHFLEELQDFLDDFDFKAARHLLQKISTHLALAEKEN